MELGTLPGEPVQPPEVAAQQQATATDLAADGDAVPFSLDRKALWSLAGQHLVSMIAS